MSFLRIENLTKCYTADVEVLTNINIQVEKKDFLVLVGPSGCGKSTLLNLIAGLDEVTSGNILIDGKNVVNEAPANRDIAMVFQSYALYPNMSVRDNITFGLEMRKVPKEERIRKSDEAGEILQISHLMDRKPSALSGGQRQRVAMGRALVRDPAIFLFDEPLSNLDAKLRVDMRTEIKRLHQSLGVTSVYVTHDQIEAMTLATKIAVMNGGVIQHLGTPHEIYYKPANLFVASFMGSPSMNIFEVDVTQAADSNPEIVLETGEDSSRKIPLPGINLPPGRYMLGLRPEHISDVDPTARTSPEFARFRSTVEVVEPAGADTYVVVPLGSEKVVARLNGEVTVKAGDDLELSINLKRIHFFDKESENRVSTEAVE